jgi:competence protein ComEC
MQSDSATAGPRTGARLSSRLSIVPLFHAAWLFALGITLTKAMWLRPSVLLLALLPIGVLCALAAVRAQRMIWLPVGVLWCLLGAWCAEMEPQPAPARELRALSDGLLRTVEGTVIDAGPVRGQIEQNLGQAVPTEATQQATQRIDLRVSAIENVTDDEDAEIPVSGGVRLTIRWPDVPEQPFRCGERVHAVARLRPPEVYRDPGTWSREDYLLGQGITATASIDSARIERIGSAVDSGSERRSRWRKAGESVRCRLSEAQRAASTRLLALPAATRPMPAPLRLSRDDAVMLAAMVTGDRTFLSHSLRVGFERTGSFHMLVVSGFHLAIVAWFIFWIAKQLHLPRMPATLLTIAASFAYALFTGFATPVQRSLWMVTLYLLGRLVYRQRSVMNTIGFAALCLLAVSPRSLFDSGFQMTLLAVVSIGGIANPLLRSTIDPYLKAARNLPLIAIDVKLPPREAQFRVTLRMIAERLQAAFNRRIAWKVFPWAVQSLLRVCELIVVACVVELAMTLPMAI